MNLKVLENAILYGAPQLHIHSEKFPISGYIANNGTYFLDLRGLHKVFGFDVKSDIKILELLQHINRFDAVSQELLDALKNAKILLYDIEKSPIKVFPVAFFSILLQTIVSAKNNGYLNINQLKSAKAATALLDFISKNDLKNLIDESSGFNFQKTTARKRMQICLSDKQNHPALDWTLVLPEGFFDMLNDLYGFDWKQLYNNPEIPAKIVNDLVFARLSPATLQNLAANKPKRSYKGKIPQNQLPSDFKKYLDSLLQLAQTSGYHPNIFNRLLNAMHPKNPDWTITDSHFNGVEKTSNLLSDFNMMLSKSLSTGFKKLK